MSKNKVSKKEVLQEGANDPNKLLQYCATHNTFSFNMNKALEECVEFMEVLLKLQTKKKEGLKGITKDDAIKEFEDFRYRAEIALMSMFPELTRMEIVNIGYKHRLEKINKLKGYLKEGKYKGGL